ncbi:MAG: RES family NAD+ phosphorylase [Gemmatimonadota bacterium]|nr:RES family NAD+ phosphorylase [Gemmatimonadota bacterium]
MTLDRVAGSRIHVHRICRRSFVALDGRGAFLYGGRWNTPGTAVVYASSTLALAALESLAHYTPDTAPDDLIALTIELPATATIARLPAALPSNWVRGPDHPACQAAGDEWARAGSTLALRVPSAIVPEEENVLLNPLHAQMARVRVVARRDFSFDPRIAR